MHRVGATPHMNFVLDIIVNDYNVEGACLVLEAQG